MNTVVIKLVYVVGIRSRIYDKNKAFKINISELEIYYFHLLFQTILLYPENKEESCNVHMYSLIIFKSMRISKRNAFQSKRYEIPLGRHC